MKVSAVTQTFQPFSQVRERADSSGERHREEKEKQEKRQESGSDGKPGGKDFDEKVRAAVASFDGDAATQAKGLRADPVGQGPGLRVVLRDGTGAIVRQFTGEEFLQLREAASGQRGRLLDRKL